MLPETRELNRLAKEYEMSLPSYAKRIKFLSDRRNKRNKKKHRKVFPFKSSFSAKYKFRPCFDCGKQYSPWVMQFDHRPGETKLFNVAEKATVPNDRLLSEISKCDIVCANCHAERTWQRNQERIGRNTKNVVLYEIY